MIKQSLRGFTLIELMTVVLVIAVLSGLIIGMVGQTSERSKTAKTSAMVNFVQLALSERSYDTSNMGALCLHPFANLTSQDGMIRSRWFRPDSRRSLERTQMALISERDGWASSERLVKRDDVFAGVTGNGDVPHLYGIFRYQARILGAAPGMGDYRRVAGPAGSPGGIDDPREYLYNVSTGPLDLADNGVFESAVSDAIDFSLGDRLDKLSEIGGITSVDRLSESERDALELGFSGRVWLGKQCDTWKGGTVWDEDGTWTKYHLRGKHLIDVWEVELLCYLSDAGVVVASAGSDQSFVYSPGKNDRVDTDLGSEPMNDDMDARSDNVVAGVGAGFDESF